MTPFENLFTQPYQKDIFPLKILDILVNETKHSQKTSLVECSQSPDGLLLYRRTVYVPEHN